MADLQITGGREFRSALRKAQRARGVDSVKVGFFKTARYPDGTPVAAVAAWNEFGTEVDGTEWIPERPFFRNAARKARPLILEHLKRRIDPKTLQVDQRLADEIGLILQNAIQTEIVELKTPENAPITIHGGILRIRGKVVRVKGKKSENPLIDTGTMRTAVTWVVEL